MFYKTWLNEWLNVYKKPFVKEHTLYNIKTNIRLHIPERLKNKQLKDLTALDIQKALNGVKKTKTRQEVYSIYNNSLKTAYKLDLIIKDLSLFIDRPKHVRVLGKALNKNELTQFLKDIKGNRCEFVFRFCLLSGCRRSEALSLCWRDIDFDNKTIHIKGTKTIASDRYIPLLKDCENLLLEVRTKNKKNNGKIFKHRADYVTKQFKKLCPTHKLHDLRHTFATRCLECGINIKVVQKWLGHTRLDTTASIYTHIFEDFIKIEASKFHL